MSKRVEISNVYCIVYFPSAPGGRVNPPPGPPSRNRILKTEELKDLNVQVCRDELKTRLVRVFVCVQQKA